MQIYLWGFVLIKTLSIIRQGTHTHTQTHQTGAATQRLWHCLLLHTSLHKALPAQVSLPAAMFLCCRSQEWEQQVLNLLATVQQALGSTDNPITAPTPVEERWK